MDQKITELPQLAILTGVEEIYTVKDTLDYSVTLNTVKNFVLGSYGLVDNIPWNGTNWTSIVNGVTANNIQTVLVAIGFTGPSPVLFSGSTEGQTPELWIRGWKTGDVLRTMQMGISSTIDDCFDFHGLTNFRFISQSLVVSSEQDAVFWLEANRDNNPGYSTKTSYIKLTRTGSLAEQLIGLAGEDNRLPNGDDGVGFLVDTLILGSTTDADVGFITNDKKAGGVESGGHWRLGTLSDADPGRAADGEYHTIYARDNKSLRLMGAGSGGLGFRTMFGSGLNVWQGEMADNTYSVYADTSIKMMSPIHSWGIDDDFGSGTYTERMGLTSAGLRLFDTGARVNAIEIALTNSADKVPNSAAVFALIGYTTGSFTVGSLTTDGTDYWIDVNHSTGRQLIGHLISDSSGTRITPDRVEYTDSNNIRIYLTSFQPTFTGTWNYSIG